jgi:hypothetical protein
LVVAFGKAAGARYYGANAKPKEKEVTDVDLVKRLKKHDFTETEASITNKLQARDVFRDVLSGLPCGDGA